MKKRTPPTKDCRVLIRAVPGISAERQREAAAVVCGLGARVIEFDGASVEQWFERARHTETAVVYRLEIIPPLRSNAFPSPTAFLGRVEGFFKAQRITLIESETGKSPDAKRWREAEQHIARGHRSIAGRERQREAGRATAEKLRRESPVLYWKQHPERERFCAIWMSRKYANSKEAAEAVNVEAERCRYQRIGSVASCNRAFGSRGSRKQRDR